MKRRKAIILFTILPMICNFSPPIRGLAPSQSQLQTTRIMHCLTPGEISDALIKLTADYSEVQEARKMFLAASGRSPKCRQQIITSLMAAMASNIDITHDQSSNYLWLEGSELLGDLKAIEALDLLISHLGMTDGGFSTTMSHQPALSGVIKIGSRAVPKLEAVLANNPDAGMRWSVIYCLSLIGGRTALTALRHAQQRETDPCLSKFMRGAVDSLSNRQHKFKLTKEWAQGSICS